MNKLSLIKLGSTVPFFIFFFFLFIFFERGLNDPALCVAITLAFIVFLDANSLRGQIEKQAKAINALNTKRASAFMLRERIGHTKIEILTGAFLGTIIGASIHLYKVQI